MGARIPKKIEFRIDQPSAEFKRKVSVDKKVVVIKRYAVDPSLCFEKSKIFNDFINILPIPFPFEDLCKTTEGAVVGAAVTAEISDTFFRIGTTVCIVANIDKPKINLG